MLDRYHMIDYIHEGPEALRRTLEANERPVQELAEAMTRRGVERVILTGIGSSHTALTMAAPLWSAHSRRMVYVVESAEFASLPAHILDEKAVVFSVSRSGERGLVVDSVQRARQAGAVSVAISGSVESLLAKQAQHALITSEGPEVTFPKTKSVIATTGLLMRLALSLGSPDDPGPARHLVELKAAHADMARTIEAVEPELLRLLPEITQHSLVAVCGSGANFGVALEGAMKIQEASFVPVYANSTDGLINGPVGALNDRWLVIPLVGAGDEVLTDRLLKIAHGFGAHSLVVAEPGTTLTEKPTYSLRLAGRVDSALAPLLFLPVLQLLAYHWTVSRGMNPDAPASMAAILDAVLAPGRQEPELREK
jgi:fructoselysine-6-P-deglycase FrlB-like protein